MNYLGSKEKMGKVIIVVEDELSPFSNFLYE